MLLYSDLQLTEKPWAALFSMSWLLFYLCPHQMFPGSSTCIFPWEDALFLSYKGKTWDKPSQYSEINTGVERKYVVITWCQKLQTDRKLKAHFAIFLDKRQKRQKMLQLSIAWGNEFISTVHTCSWWLIKSGASSSTSSLKPQPLALNVTRVTALDGSQISSMRL